jgi:prepilin-type processing-associated H-X9-DG protein
MNNVFPVNQFGVMQNVNILRCPSDGGQQVYPEFGPTNYVGCIGDGAKGGTRINADGMFFQNSKISIRDITDGTSNTAMMSEQLLGMGDPNITDPAIPIDVRYYYAQKSINENVTDSECQSITAGGGGWTFKTDRGAKWADGEVQYCQYDHHYPPNAKAPRWDCIKLEHSFKAARSMHSGGVNLLLADGSARFVADNVDITTWQALGTRNGGEVNGDY